MPNDSANATRSDTNTMNCEPGFRLSLTDIIILIIGAAVSAVFALNDSIMSVIVVFVVGHFFLFCNVFRISRPSELIWAAVFLFLSALTFTVGYPGWFATFSSSAIITLALIFREMKRPSYHGVLWYKINPGFTQRRKKHVYQGLRPADKTADRCRG